MQHSCVGRIFRLQQSAGKDHPGSPTLQKDVEMNAPLAKEQIALLMSSSLTYRSPVIEGTDGTIAEARPSMFQRLSARVQAAVIRVMELPQRRAVLDELNVLSDRELADIGLTRAELGSVFDPHFVSSRSN